MELCGCPRPAAPGKFIRVKRSSPPAASGPPAEAAPRRFLYATAAVAGGSIMVIEILGAKMLSPFFGLSHFVWTAQIAVTLVALACGYYVGGRVADRSQRLPILFGSILAAAVCLCFSVLICESVSYWCLNFNLAMGSLLASMMLFFVPLALLAVTGPFLVRVITSSLSGVGGSVGRLTSISTLGSFAGTLWIGYFMIPWFPNSVTMFITSGVLMLVALSYFICFRRRAGGPLAIVILAAAAAGAGLYVQARRQPGWVVERFRGNSHFGMLQVLERTDTSARFYLNDNLVQNTYDPLRQQSLSAFTYMLSRLARAYTTNISEVLCVGLGVGIVPMEFAHTGARVDVVEINPAVVPLAARWFDLRPEQLEITIDDGRHFLNRCRKQYDVVVLDAFLGDSSPSHLLTREAFASIRRVLRPGGTLVINSFGELDPERDYFTASLYRTLQAVFGGVKLHTSNEGAMFFVASPRPNLAMVHPPQLDDVHPQARAETQAAFAGLTQPNLEHGRVLTDDYNPIEYYDAKNREEIRRRLALAARRF